MSAVDGLAVAFGGIGACFFLAALIPQFYGTYQTKNTVGINKLMFILHLIVGLSFFYGAVFLGVGAGEKWNLITQSVIFTVLNFVSSMGSLYTVLLKNQNKKEADSLGISELDHYHQYCIPCVLERDARRNKSKEK